MVFACNADNDLHRVLAESGRRYPRFDTAADAVERAEPGSGVLVLADGYPEALTDIDVALFDQAAERGLRLYVEYPAALPGLEVGAPQRTVWERAVVASDAFGDSLPRLRILAVHDCHFTLVQADEPLLVVARVAGFDTAVYGLPDEAFPMLFRLPGRDVLVSTTRLSGFVSGRYAPTDDWKTVWESILSMLERGDPPPLAWTPTVIPASGPDEQLPPDIERRAFSFGVKWFLDSRLLIHQSRMPGIQRLLEAGAEVCETPGPVDPAGDGSLGILEGFSSIIRSDGSQLQRTLIRSDCNAESAMALALGWAVNSDSRCRDVARNLLDFIYFHSNMHGGVRGDPAHPAFGLIAWGTGMPSLEVANYGDDDARVLLGTMVTAACLESDAWDASMMRALLANLRTTGPLGFRGGRIDVPDLEKNGWRHYFETPRVNIAPHYEAYLWACNLWAYRQTGYRPFLDRATSAIGMTMEAYPDRWRWTNGLAQERARMLLPLAWLVRLEDTPEHREWLKVVAGDLIAAQQPCGALMEHLGPAGMGDYDAPASNEKYGTDEAPLIQQNGDPASDLLYTTNFAFLGLHEAAAATEDPAIKAAEDRLAEFLCRIQVRSRKHPYLDGGWFRAFDFGRWECWASSSDIGWGAWSIESGWSQSWITAILGLRLMGTSVWEMTRGIRVAEHLEGVQKLMAT